MSEPTDSFHSLTPFNHRAVRKEAKQRSKLTNEDQLDFENKLWTIVHGLQPSAITLGRDPTIQLHDLSYRPDVFALFDTFALVAESTYSSSKAFVSEELSRLEQIKPKLSRYLHDEMDNRKLVSILIVKDKTELHDSIKQRAHNSDVKLLDARDVDYYITLLRQAGVGISHLFFGRVAPSVLRIGEHKIPAIQIREGGRYKYIFSVSPYELLERAFISHRELTSPQEAYVGYQRMLNKKKLKEIKAYVSQKQSFPAPIIVSFPKNAGEDFKPLPKKATESLEGVILGYLRLPTKPASIYIVDGQHRLYGYTLLPRSDEHHINVVAYKGLQPHQQGSMFVDINLKQTKVPARLLWELYPDILSQDDDEYFKAVVSRAVERLIPPHLSGIVSHISSGSKGRISFQALCSEVVRARLLAKGGIGIVGSLAGHDWQAQEDRLFTILSAFLQLLNNRGQDWPEVNNRFFLQNTGIIPLIRELGKACKHLSLYNPSVLTTAKSSLMEGLVPYFEPLYTLYGSYKNEDLDYLTRSRVGSAGFIETADEMDDIIRETIPSFPLREKRTPPHLQQEVDTFVSLIQEVNRLAQDRSQEWVFREFDKDRTAKVLLKPARDVAALEKFVGTIYQELVEASNREAAHNRALDILGMTEFNQVPPIRNLSLLRHVSAHRASHIDPARRRKAIAFLRQLSGVSSLSDFDDLQTENCVAVQIALLKEIQTGFLEPLRNAIKAPSHV